METETPAEPIVVDEAGNQSFLGFKFGALINSEKSVDFQQLRKTLSTMDCSSGFRGNGGRRARCRSCNQYNSAPGGLVCNKAFEICSSALGAKTFGEVSLWTCDSRALFSG